MPRRRKLSPEPFELTIDSLLGNGRGGAAREGKSLEVHDALPGETVMARHLFGRRMRGQAQTLEVLEPSPERIEPRCPHFGTCSACTLQHMDHSAQLDFKQRVLLDHLAAAGGLAPGSILPPLAGERWHYRRKARLSVRYVKGKGRVLVGFRERDGRFLADIRECHILPQPVAERLTALSELVGLLESFESIPQIEVTCGDGSAALVFRHLELLPEGDLERLREFARTTGLAVLLQPKGPDSVRSLEPTEPDLRYALPEYGLEYRFEPLDFVQVNGELNRLMIRQALDLLAPEPGDRVLDLFCGLGNFTLPMAKNCGHVTGMEGDEKLVQRARENAALNGIENVEFRQADLYTTEAIKSWPDGSFERVLLDPPRSGAEPILTQIAATGAGKVVYVSCNPATLARDAAHLVNRHGFTLEAAGIMDMFPHTAHVESMALFERH